jgi:hypothetical protein
MSPSPRIAPDYAPRSIRAMAALACVNANRKTDCQFGLVIFVGALTFLLVVFA